MFSKVILTLSLVILTLTSLGQTEGMAFIKSGTYIPLYGTDSNEVVVDDFELDVTPVTNKEFRAFLKENDKWQKGKVVALFADENYLSQFKDDMELEEGWYEDGPVTNVSWFAAKEYCKYQGKRLPTMDEWEYAAMADDTAPDARNRKDYNQYILDWYGKPNSYSHRIKSTFKNYWGVWDMHGLVWEWTNDFNSVLISNDPRGDDVKSNLFCGGAAVGATDVRNYAAFMRYAFRSSVKSKYAVRNLGFRCAKSK